MAQEIEGGGVLSTAPGKRKASGQVYVVVVEWENGEPETLAAFTGTTAKQRAERYAEEKRHEYAAGLWISGKCYSVWGHEGNEDPDWDVDVHVEAVETNPKIPYTYRRGKLREERRIREAVDERSRR